MCKPGAHESQKRDRALGTEVKGGGEQIKMLRTKSVSSARAVSTLN